jgi:hypothetical protein
MYTGLYGISNTMALLVRRKVSVELVKKILQESGRYLQGYMTWNNKSTGIREHIVIDCSHLVSWETWDCVCYTEYRHPHKRRTRDILEI